MAIGPPTASSPCTTTREARARPNDYQPHATPLGPKADQRITTSGGRSTNSDLPYFNVEWPGQGVIVVLGWPGQWAAEFKRDEADGPAGSRRPGTHPFQTAAGRRGSHAAGRRCNSGKAIGSARRTSGGGGCWPTTRRAPAAKPMPPVSMMCTSDFYPGMKSNAADEIKYVDAYWNAGVKFDYWWIDAGWYPCDDADWGKVGTWEPDGKSLSQGPEGGRRPRARQGHEARRLVRAGAGPRRHLPGSRSIPTGCWAADKADC